MTQQLESDLRDALTARAAELPADAADRLRRRDYRPRTRGLGPPVAAGALSVAAAGVGVWLVGLGPGTPAAFAGWTARPTRVGGAHVTNVAQGCRAHLAAAPTKPTPPHGTTPPSVRGLKAVLADTRGPFTFVIFAGRDVTASCISGPSFTELSVNGSPERVTPSAGRAIVTAEPKLISPGRHAYSFAQGVTGAGVTGVTLVLDDGTRVVSSLGHQRFVAWWPGLRTATSADVSTETGTTSQRVPVAGPPDGGPHGTTPTRPGTRSFGVTSATG